MSPKKFEHIIEWQARQFKRKHRFEQFGKRHDSLRAAFEYLRSSASIPQKPRRELLRYIPIGIVAAIEGYFVLAIRDLMNFGEPFSSKATKVVNQKFDVTSLFHVSRGTVTPGELVSHSLSFSRIENMNSMMSEILGENFSHLVEEQTIECPHCGEVIRISSLFNSWMKSLIDLYETRHILCHEIGKSVSLRLKDLDNWLSISDYFILFTEMVLTFEIDSAEGLPF